MESKWVTFRIVLLFAMVQVVLLNNYYGGGIVSSLLTEPAKTIRTIQNLIDCNLEVGYENVSHNRGLFEVRLPVPADNSGSQCEHSSTQTFVSVYLSHPIERMSYQYFYFVFSGPIFDVYTDYSSRIFHKNPELIWFNPEPIYENCDLTLKQVTPYVIIINNSFFVTSNNRPYLGRSP